MKTLKRLKRSVALGLQRALSFWGGRGQRPNASVRQVPAVSSDSSSDASAARALDRSTFAEVATLSWPIAVAMLGDTAMGLVDTKLVAGLGPAALGGVGVATTIMYLGYAIVFGLMRGVKVRTSHALGEGRPHDGLRYAHAGMVMGAVAGLVIWLLSRDVTFVLTHLGVDSKTVPYARDFLAARTLGAPAICLLTAMVQYRQGVGDTRTPMVVGLLGNIVNAFLAYGLIYGRFGLPALGVTGAGYGTAIAESSEVAIMLVVIVRSGRAQKTRSTMTLRRAIAEVAQLGVPTGAQFGMEMLAFTAFTAILGGIGAGEVAAHQVAMAIIRTSFLPGVAVAEAGSVLIGRALGRRLLGEADRVMRSSVLIAAGFMTACGVVFALAGGVIARAFTDDPEVASVVRRLLLVAAIFQTLDAVTIVLRGALRGAKDVRVVAIIGITVAWCCIPTAAYFLGRRLGWGAIGGWCGFVAETTIAAVLFHRRWRRGAWRARYSASPEVETQLTTVQAA